MRCTFAVLMLLLSAAAGQAKPAADPTAATIRSALKRADQAASRKDLDEFMSLFTSDYTSLSDKNKKITRAELRQAFAHNFSLYHDYRLDTALGNLKVNGDKAVADAAGRQTFTVLDPRTKQPRLGTSTFLRHDYWLKTGKGWKIARSIVLPAPRTTGGKAAKHKAR